MKKIFQFLISFIFFSLLFFAIWFFFKDPYTVILGHSFSLVSDLFALPFVTTIDEQAITITIRHTTIKIDTLYLISNMVVLMALVFSTPFMWFGRKLVCLFWGILFLFIYHLISLYIILIAHGISPNAVGFLQLIKAIFLVIYSFSEQIGKAVMPFIIWLFLARGQVFGKIKELSAPEDQLAGIDLDSEGQEQDKEKGLEQDPGV
ncbi:hypothetical protein JXQ70_03580 [bacterium]|nr:hypothetical protein [bacterium]